MNEGWIKLHRQLKEWQHYQEPFVLLVWLDLLLSANMKAGWVRGNRINRGQLITSVARIMESTGIGSDNTVRDALRKLEESGEIKKEQIGIGTKITINHFNKFQTYAQDAQPSAQPTAEVGAYLSAEVGAQPTAQPGADKQEYIEREERKEGKNINPLPHARAREIGIEAFGSFSNVFLFPAEHRTLSETYGQELTDKAVDDLSCKIAEGDDQALNSRNHYATLDRWLRYKRETAKVPLSSKPQANETNEEFVIRIAWQALTDKEKKDYMDTHDGKTLIETKGAI